MTYFRVRDGVTPMLYVLLSGKARRHTGQLIRSERYRKHRST